MVDSTACGAATDIWNVSDGLSERVKSLREEYFSFDEREFRNEVIGFTTGDPDDILFSSYHWGVAPEAFMFAKSFKATLGASAIKVDLPEGFWKNSIANRRAIFFSEVINKYLPAQILKGELIVGGQFNTALSKTLNPEETKRWKKREKKWFRKNAKLNIFGIGNCGAIPGHLIPDYPTVVKHGFKHLHEKFTDLKDGASKSHKDYLDALIASIESIPLFTERYAKLSEKHAEKADNQYRKEELLEIARICRKVPWEPAETFWEALQSLWFTHMLVMAAESYPGPGVSPGRIDQYLYPYFKKDIENGNISREFAAELLQCWFIKPNYAYDYMGRVGTLQGINSSFGQLITLAGCGPQGEDMSNDLTILILDVIGDMNLLEPKPNVRLHNNISEQTMEKVVDLVGKAQGAPFLLNFDEISMKALAWSGLPKDKLWDYAPVGCLENTLQGNDRSGTVDINLNMAKAMELVFTNGRDQKLKLRTGVKTGDPLNFTSFEQFKNAFFKQLEKIAKDLIDAAFEADAMRAEFEPTPYLSTLVRGCETSGKDVTAGGAEHNYLTVEGVALATVIDSLAAVKKLVFDEGKVSMRDLKKAIENNYENDERLRQLLVNRAPKYGNDDDGADELAGDLNNFMADMVSGMTSPITNRKLRMGYLSWNYWIFYAGLTSATPDGRKRGTYLSNGVCPVTGADSKGPVSVSRSVFNLDLEKVPNGGSHTISFNPVMAATQKGRDNLKAFLKAYGIQGGSALQINMVNPETLVSAQKSPDEYSNLLVRVTGYNAYFTALGKEIQDEIISRESHRLKGEN
jgi:trans-4-hydroxy-L-proline dehydratase